MPIFPSHPHRVRQQRLSCPTLLSITILMGLSHGITVHCGNSFTNERHKSIQHPHSPKIRRVKLNKTQKELQQAQQKQNEHMACTYPLLLLVVLTQLSPSAVLSFQERQDFYLSENDFNMELAGGDDVRTSNNTAVLSTVTGQSIASSSSDEPSRVPVV